MELIGIHRFVKYDFIENQKKKLKGKYCIGYDNENEFPMFYTTSSAW